MSLKNHFVLRWKRWALALVLTPLLLLLLVWLLLPHWVQNSGARLASEALGREVSMGEVHFKPWRLALEVEGLRIAGAPGQSAPLLELAHLEAALSLRSILHASPVLSSLSLDRPVLRLSREAEGRYDIDDLIARFTKPPAKPGSKPEDPPDLALYNIRLSGGQVLLNDKPLAREHALTALELELPYLSTLDADVKVHVKPRLTGKFNGVAFGSQVEALPFADQAEARLDFKLDGLDLAPYVGYFPDALPLRLKHGLVDARLALQFNQAPKAAPKLILSGEVALRDFVLNTPADQPWLAWQTLSVSLKDVQPLQRQIQLGVVSLRGPSLALRRDAAGRLWLPDTGAPAPAPSKTPSAWRFGFERFELAEGALDWQDAKPAAALRIEGMQAKLGAFNWPLATAVPVSYALRVHTTANSKTPAEISGEGSLGKEQLSLTTQWQDLALAGLSPYLPAYLDGLAKGRAELSVAQPLEPGAETRAKLALRDLALSKLRVAASRSSEPLLNLAALTLDELTLDTASRKVEGGELRLKQAQLNVARDAQGHFSYEALLPSPATQASTSPPWALQLRTVALEQGALRLRDANAAAVDVDQLQLRLQNLVWPARSEAMPVQLALQIGAPQARANQRGSVNWQGQVLLAPMSAMGKLRVERLPLQLINPYLDPSWGMHLRRAELGLRGEFSVQDKPAGLQAQLAGDVLVADLRLQQGAQAEGQRGENLLSWQALNLDGLKLALMPGAAPSLEVNDARLNDFYARLDIDEKGQLNLRAVGPQAAASAPAAAPATAGPSLRIAVRQTRVSGGQVDFSDHFVRPNYSAKLSDLTGSLGSFATGKPEMAALNLKGRVAGTGILEITGQANPSGAPLMLDITAKASDIELAPLSPYAAKYAGYAIERGKLSTKVSYKVDAGGALQADNQIILNQLTFGDKVDSPEATGLPVLLAVALLKDRNGVIDVNLPVAGSINDPDFSIGGLVLKLILNLLGKALTSPFSLFSGGSSEDLSQAAFAPGSALPATPAQLEQVAKMLNERPALNLTVTGWADLGAEKAALQQRQLDEALLAERRRELRRQQTAAADARAAAASAVLGDADRARLLKQVYEAATLPKKPRNLLGMAKDIPAAEMQALLLESYAVSDERVRELALQRGVTIRDELIAKGVPNSRIFLAAPRLREGDASSWSPHADLKLSAQ